MKRTLALAGIAVLTSSLLTGCGGSSTDSYCEDLKSVTALFNTPADEEATSADAAKLMATTEKFAKSGPKDVRDDWATLHSGFKGVDDVLKSVGLSLADIDKLFSDELPEGVDQAEVAAVLPKLQEAMEKMDDESFSKAADDIEKHAKESCGIDLSGDE